MIAESFIFSNFHFLSRNLKFLESNRADATEVLRYADIS